MKTSITHHHLCGVINTEISRFASEPTIRILDMGCGDGRLTAFLQTMISRLNPDKSIEVYGFDVDDSNVQPATYFNNTIALLHEKCPDIDWSARLTKISSKAIWPYQDNFFHFVISNQVMEHVHDHDFTLNQLHRVLVDRGLSAHLFPLKHCFWEGHLYLFFAHWISDSDVLFQYIKYCSLLGMGKYRSHMASGRVSDVTDYSRKHADYMIYETNYLSIREMHKLAKNNQLRCSFRYTDKFYANKLREVFSLEIKYRYASPRHLFLQRLLFSLLVRISSITLVLEKQNTYIYS